MAAPLLKYTYEDYKHWKGKWELIDGFPTTARIDEKIKFKKYEKEGVKYYILAYLHLFAKVYENKDGFKKIGDFTNKTITLNSKCKVEINFDNIFKKLRSKH